MPSCLRPQLQHGNNQPRTHYLRGLSFCIRWTGERFAWNSNTEKLISSLGSDWQVVYSVCNPLWSTVNSLFEDEFKLSDTLKVLSGVFRYSQVDLRSYLMNSGKKIFKKEKKNMIPPLFVLLFDDLDQSLERKLLMRRE